MPGNCSYCNDPSHNVRNCVNPHIPIFYQRILNMYNTCLVNEPDRTRSRATFATQLCQNFDLRTLKAVGIKYASARSHYNKYMIALQIHTHFNNVNNVAINNVAINEVETPIPIMTPIPIRRQNNWIITRIVNENTNYNVYNINTPTHTDLLQWNSDRSMSPLIPRNLAEEFGNKYDIHLSQCDAFNLKEDDCSICYNKMNEQNMVQLNCKHQFCVDCMCSYFNMNNTKLTCALCREPMSNINVPNKNVYDSLSNYLKN